MDVYLAEVKGVMSLLNDDGSLDFENFYTRLIVEDVEGPWHYVKNELAPSVLKEEHKNFNKILKIELKSWRRHSLGKLINILAEEASMENNLN